MIKLCLKCELKKPLDSFYNNRTTKDGKTGHCKDCYQIYYLDNRDNYLSNFKTYAKANRKKINQYYREYQQEHKENRKKINQRYNLKRKSKP